MGQNRILVNSGVETLAGTRWAGMKALMEVADLQDSEIMAEDLAFRLAPRLNAPGRLGDPDIGIQVLTTTEPISAKNLALRINAANSKRQSIERDISERIEDMLETRGGVKDRRTLFLGAEDWHKGVLGIVAQKFDESKTARPDFGRLAMPFWCDPGRDAMACAGSGA